jgi:hypothetical protein
MNAKGDVIYNAGEIKDLTTLVQRCLAGYHYA